MIIDGRSPFISGAYRTGLQDPRVGLSRDPEIPARLHAEALELAAPDSGRNVLRDILAKRKGAGRAAGGRSTFVNALRHVALKPRLVLMLGMVPVPGLRAPAHPASGSECYAYINSTHRVIPFSPLQ
jgi:hypothetical protein